jgi:hypothetical protein
MVIVALGINTALSSVPCRALVDLGLVSRLLLSTLKNSSFFLEHFVVEILVMIIPSKCLLDILLVQKEHILLDLFAILVFPLAVGIVGIEVVFIWRDKGSFHFLVQQVIPGEVPQPRMILDIVRTVET